MSTVRGGTRLRDRCALRMPASRRVDVPEVRGVSGVGAVTVTCMSALMSAKTNATKRHDAETRDAE